MPKRNGMVRQKRTFAETRSVLLPTADYLATTIGRHEPDVTQERDTIDSASIGKADMTQTALSTSEADLTPPKRTWRNVRVIVIFDSGHD